MLKLRCLVQIPLQTFSTNIIYQYLQALKSSAISIQEPLMFFLISLNGFESGHRHGRYTVVILRDSKMRFYYVRSIVMLENLFQIWQPSVPLNYS